MFKMINKSVKSLKPQKTLLKKVGSSDLGMYLYMYTFMYTYLKYIMFSILLNISYIRDIVLCLMSVLAYS